ncbi:hypothetical protein [Mordavella massiliensis]|uniref:Uncharacterized protein n=1 Tax=Mordavella massiliensis TaxID=1871024 RepID=A0A938XFW5_9CLOT|nr:hypothetical protein [Mordavella massiliensis]MBM6949307.1 hypothetical protein [Mordavella massiliensis]
MAFTRPGTTRIEIEGNEPYEITIEEPVINTNLPKRIQTGTKMQMTTSLGNTMLEDKKIDEISNRGIYDTKAAIGYQPKVEILSGADLVKRENGDYSNILSSSEDITFTGEGTVTFKVTYEMLPFKQVASGESVAVSDEVYYSPEATFSVDIVSELPAVEVTDKTGDGVAADLTGVDTDKICADNNVNTAEHDIEIVLSQEEATDEDGLLLEQMADKAGYSVKNVYEVVMTLFADGKEISNITDDFGALKMNLYAGKQHAGEDACVYQLHNGAETIRYDDLKVNEDGFVEITVDRLSTFAVAVKDTQSIVTPADPGTETGSADPNANGNAAASLNTGVSSETEAPRTGDSANLFVWNILCICSLGAVVVFCMRKIKRTLFFCSKRNIRP